MILSLSVLAFFTLQRLGELVLNRRNAARLMARGAREVAEPTYWPIVALHVAWLAGLWWLGWYRPMSPWWLIPLAATQLVRAWTMSSLGERWTTQIIVLPGAPRIRTGPYRFLPHPNYAVVALEVALVPLAFGLPWYAGAFTLLNAPLTWLRIRTEDRALAEAERSQSSPCA